MLLLYAVKSFDDANQCAVIAADDSIEAAKIARNIGLKGTLRSDLLGIALSNAVTGPVWSSD